METDTIKSPEVSLSNPASTDILYKLQDFGSIEFALGVSIGLILFISLIKYFINNKSSKGEWFLLGIEIPVDICSVLITIIISMYLGAHLGWGISLLVVMLIVTAVCSILRRTAMDLSYGSDKKIFKAGIFATIEIVIVIGIVLFVYRIITYN